MIKHTANMRPDKVARNVEIWKQVVIAGRTYQDVGDELGLSMQRIAQIVAQVDAQIPAEHKDQTRVHRKAFLDKIREELMAIALMDPDAVFAPNGKIVPGIKSYAQKLQALKLLLDVDVRVAKLSGTDNAVEHTVTVTAEAQQATKDQADKISKSLETLMVPMSAEVAAHAARS